MKSTMDTATPESLLDEADFLEELASLEDGMTVKPRQYAATSEVLAPVRTRPPGKFEATEPPQHMPAVEDGPSAMQQIAAVAMFVFMMAVGAAGAAMVFHERVARILASW